MVLEAQQRVLPRSAQSLFSSLQNGTSCLATNLSTNLTIWKRIFWGSNQNLRTLDYYETVKIIISCMNENEFEKTTCQSISIYEFSVIKIAPASADNGPTLKNESLLHTAIDPIRFSFFAKGHKASCGTAGNEHLYTPLSFRCKGHTVAETCHKLPTSTKYIGIRVGPLSSTIRRSLAKREFLIIKQLWPYQLT